MTTQKQLHTAGNFWNTYLYKAKHYKRKQSSIEKSSLRRELVRRRPVRVRRDRKNTSPGGACSRCGTSPEVKALQKKRKRPTEVEQIC